MPNQLRTLDILLPERIWQYIDQHIAASKLRVDVCDVVATAAAADLERRVQREAVIAECFPKPTHNESIPTYHVPPGHPSPANRPRCVSCGAPVNGEAATCGRPECGEAVQNKTTSIEEGAQRTGNLPEFPDEDRIRQAAGRAAADHHLDDAML